MNSTGYYILHVLHATEFYFLADGAGAGVANSKRIVTGRGEVRIIRAACATDAILVPLMHERHAPKGMLAAFISGQTPDCSEVATFFFVRIALPCCSSIVIPRD